jgi:RHS repeat-associated protein
VTAVEILGDIGTPVGKVTTSYDPATGDALTTALPDGSTITRGYDRLGRLRTYTDADGSTTTTEFDRFGKPARITDTLGASQSFTYDRTIEPRGLLTSVTDSVAGTMTARYGPDGQITEQTLPGGVNLTTTQTPTGLTSGYYVNDLLATQQQGDQRMSWTLDPNLRARRFTSEKQVNGAWANNVTKINHYGADNDEPRWIAEDLTQPDNLTRNIESPDGDLAATTSKTGDVVLQLTSLHGDVMATVPVDPGGSTITGAVTVVDTDEFGLPSADTPAAATARYGWLGGKQRSGETLGDTILMGARVYDPASGRFLQVDPEPGGNATAYDYCSADPVNCTDLDGRWSIGSIFKSVATVAARVGELASWIPGPIGAIGAGVAAGAYAATGNWRKAGEMALVGAAALVGAGAVVKIGIRVVKAAAKASKLGPESGRLFAKHAIGARLQKARVLGDRSLLFGDTRSGIKKPGLLNRGKKFAAGWSGVSTASLPGHVKGDKTAARAVFRVKYGATKEKRVDLFYGGWRKPIPKKGKGR